MRGGSDASRIPQAHFRVIVSSETRVAHLCPVPLVSKNIQSRLLLLSPEVNPVNRV